jgi:phage baseplate assembly protein V
MLRAMVGPVLHRVKLLAQRAVVRGSRDSSKAATLDLAVLARETLRGVERFAHFGLTSRPSPGAEVVVLCLGGNRDHPIVVADEDRRHRPAGQLAEGETCLYAQGGARIFLRADGSVEIVAPGDVSVTGSLDASGELADALGTLDALRQAYNVHVHSDPQGGSTGPPTPTV